jgi:hypothetical protein
MATNKEFKVAGISTLNGATKIRFMNDIMRTKILQKNGHTDIDFVELPKPMTKADAVDYLRSINWHTDNTAVQDAMELVLYRNPRTSSHA